MSTLLKSTAILLILTLLVLSVVACGVPDEEEFEEFEEFEEDPIEDDFSFKNNLANSTINDLITII